MPSLSARERQLFLRLSALITVGILLLAGLDLLVKSLVQTSGMAENVYNDKPVASGGLITLGAAVLLVSLWMATMASMSVRWPTCIGLVAIGGGMLGNWGDSQLHGRVYDFIPVPFTGLYSNLADVFLGVGYIALTATIVLAISDACKTRRKSQPAL